MSESTVEGYLRDYLNAAVADSNLELQRAVYRLAVIAIIVALLPSLIDAAVWTLRWLSGAF